MHFPTYLIIFLISFQIGLRANTFDFSIPTEQTQFTIKNIIKIDHACHYPFNPSSIVTIMIFKKKGIDYISQGEERCAWHFAEEIETTISDSVVLPDFFKKKLLKEIKEAKNKGKTI